MSMRRRRALKMNGGGGKEGGGGRGESSFKGHMIGLNGEMRIDQN